VVLLVAVSASSWPGSAVMTSLAVILLAVLVSKQVVRAKRGDLRPDVED
jgi:hypothetical protein